MHWAALVPHSLSAPASRIDLQSLGIWALQFTPRVALLEEAVLMEVEASCRLFGGVAALHAQVHEGAKALGFEVAWAPTGLAALARVRCGGAQKHGSTGQALPLQTLLDPLPMHALSILVRHQPTLARVGCRTLGDVRALPRAGLGRRFGTALLCALDQAYGMVPEVYDWLALPEQFHARLEWLSRVDTASALMLGAHRLLAQLLGWLRARHLGVTAVTLRWRHDAMRSKTAGVGGELLVRTAQATQDVAHLARLLDAHLAQVDLKAPAGELELWATELAPCAEESHSLLPDPVHRGQNMALTLERIRARLGDNGVRQPATHADHRLEWSQAWAAKPVTHSEGAAAPVHLPLPNWILATPVRLAERDHRPFYQGRLQLLLGPDRIEGGWWHRSTASGAEQAYNVQRDYWLALSPGAGVLCIFQTRLAGEQTAWFLHGHYG